jgi:hypothetical protein
MASFDPNASFTTALNRVPPRLVESVHATMAEAVARYFRANGVEQVADQNTILGSALFSIAGAYGFRNRMRAFVGHRDLDGITRVAAALAAGALHASGGELSDLTELFGNALDEARGQLSAGDPMNETVLCIGAFDEEGSPEPADPETAAHEELMLHILDKQAETNAQLFQMQRELANLRAQSAQHATEEQRAERDLQDQVNETNARTMMLLERITTIEDVAANTQGQLVRLDLASQRMSAAPAEDDEQLSQTVDQTKARLEEFITYVQHAALGQKANTTDLDALRADVVGQLEVQRRLIESDPSSAKAVIDGMKQEFDAKFNDITRKSAQVGREAAKEVERSLQGEFGNIHNALQDTRREFETRIQGVQRSASSAAVGASPATKARISHIEANLEDTRTEFETRIQGVQRSASSAAVGASPATKMRISHIEANLAHVDSEISQAADHIRTSDEAHMSEMTQLRRLLESQHGMIAQLSTNQAKLSADYQTMQRSISQSMQQQQQQPQQQLPQSMPPSTSVASVASDAAELLAPLVDSTLLRQRKEHDRVESCGPFRADFIANDAGLRRVFDKAPRYSWFKTHSSTQRMVSTLRLVGRMLVRLEREQPDKIVGAYVVKAAKKDLEILAPDLQHLHVLCEAYAVGSAATRALLSEELAIRMDADTKPSDRQALMTMLYVARTADAGLEVKEFNEILTGERAISEVHLPDGQTEPVRMAARKGHRAGF